MEQAEPIVMVRQPGRRSLRVILERSLEIGRDCDGLLIADAQASRRHVELSATAGGIIATDLGSSNGTFIDGVRITVPTPLEPGAQLQVGNSTIEIWQLQTSAQAEPAETFDPTATSIDLVIAAVGASPVDPAGLEHNQGTITIVFSDIESSTERAVALGDAAWFKVLGKHNDIVRRRLPEYGGTEVKNQGDGFMLTFPSARGAVRCMIAVQNDLAQWRAEEPDRAIKVRMGGHVGEAMSDGEGDIFGRHVIIAARIGNIADGDQILVSSMVKELVAARGDIEFGPGEAVELKGLDGTHTVYEVQH